MNTFCWAIPFGSLWLSAAAFAQFGEEQLYNPYSISSPNGSVRLYVKSLKPHGDGPALCRLIKSGKTLWEKTLPYTFSKVVVSDGGAVGGCSFRPNADRYKNGYFIVSILDSKGQSKLYEETRIKPSRFLHTSGDPKANGLMYDATNDRMILRIVAPDINKGGESWWTYRLLTGKLIGKVPLVGIDQEKSKFLLGAIPVAGTNLVAAAWNWYDGGELGQALTLIDPKGASIWRKNIKGDFEGGRREGDEIRTRSKAMQEGTVFAGRSGEFAAHIVKSGRLVTFSLSQSGGKWRVAEAGSKPYSFKPDSVSPSVLVPKVRIPTSAEFVIPLLPSATEVRNVGQLHIWGDKIVFIREDDQPSICVVALNGSVVKSIALPKIPSKSRAGWHLAATSGSKFIVAHSTQGDKPDSKAWTIDLSTGEIKALPKFQCASIEAIAGAPNGRFAALSTEFSTYTLRSHVTYYEADGTNIWDLAENGYSGAAAEIFSPEDLDIDAKGNIVLLDKISHAIQRFKPDSKFLDRIDLDKVWGRELSYPTQITCLPDGGYWLYDFSGEPNCYLLDAKGKIRRSHGLKFSNGKKFDIHEDIKVDSAGRPWLTNGDSIFRVDEKGTVVQTIGEKARVTGLAEIADVHVALDGRIIAQDRSTNAAFAFNHTGLLLFSAVPKPTEFDDGTSWNGLKIPRSGDIYLSGSLNKGMPHWSPKGKRLSDRPRSKDEIGSEGPFAMQLGWLWEGSNLVDEKGKVRGTLRRWPNQDWMLDGPDAMAADGRLMSYQANRYRNLSGKLKIGYFSATGKPEGESPYPLGASYVYSAAYDGTMSYFVTKVGLVAVDRKGNAKWILPLDPNKAWKVFPSRGMLALFDGKQTVTWISPQRATILKESVRFPLPNNDED